MYSPINNNYPILFSNTSQRYADSSCLLNIINDNYEMFKVSKEEQNLKSDLYMAIMFRDILKFKFLLKNSKTDLTKIHVIDGHTLLGFAIKHQSNKIASYLIDERIGVNQLGSENQSPLHLAIRYGEF